MKRVLDQEERTLNILATLFHPLVSQEHFDPYPTNHHCACAQAYSAASSDVV
jgi:hypothetical protein